MMSAQAQESAIFVTYDGDTHWLECFASAPGAESGDIICPVAAGDDWTALAARVTAHQAEHGCGGNPDGNT